MQYVEYRSDKLVDCSCETARSCFNPPVSEFLGVDGCIETVSGGN